MWKEPIAAKSRYVCNKNQNTDAVPTEYDVVNRPTICNPSRTVVFLSLSWPVVILTVSNITCYKQIRDDAVHNDHTTPLPHSYVQAARLPDDFHWGDVNGVSYLTHSLNQHGA